MSANLKLEDSAGNIYNFPPDFWIENDSWSTNKNIVNKFYAPGGRNIADGFLQSRTITISGQIRADSQGEYETKYRTFIQAVLKGGKLTISNDTVSRYIEVKLPDGSNGQELGQRYKEISIDFVSEDTFWKDASENLSINVVAGDDSFTIDTTGTDFVISPEIEIEADQGVDLPSVKIINKNDGSATFTYIDPLFVQGDIVNINSETGDIKRNGGSTADKFTGVFVRLQPGSNIIEYEGGAATIIFKYRRLYL